MLEKPVPQQNPLEKLLQQCEQDLHKAADVIIEKDLIENLTHLQRMNRGGGRYYALELESLSLMINQLVSQKYSECILVNGSGTIIYSMYNDAVFGKQASRLEQTVIPRLYAEAARGGSYVSETTEFPPLSGTHVVFVSVPVRENGKVIGVLTAAWISVRLRRCFRGEPG